MKQENALVLCPPNMTTPKNGPPGILGDRIHQLPAVEAATRIYPWVYVWPEDKLVREVFRFLPVDFLPGTKPDEVIESAKKCDVMLTLLFALQDGRMIVTS
jgi:hypothetical protein